MTQTVLVAMGKFSVLNFFTCEPGEVGLEPAIVFERC